MVLERRKLQSWVPMGPETKNNSAGEGQQEMMLCSASTYRHCFSALL
jgi:hypothetical protein